MSGLEKAKELGYVPETDADDPPGRTAAYPPVAAGEGSAADTDDDHTPDLRELEVSYWVVAEAVGRALGVTPKGIERRGLNYAILYDAEVDG
jgi:hypothetical protein